MSVCPDGESQNEAMAHKRESPERSYGHTETNEKQPERERAQNEAKAKESPERSYGHTETNEKQPERESPERSYGQKETNEKPSDASDTEERPRAKQKAGSAARQASKRGSRLDRHAGRQAAGRQAAGSGPDRQTDNDNDDDKAGKRITAAATLVACSPRTRAHGPSLWLALP
jgi:hypothetical protein